MNNNHIEKKNMYSIRKKISELFKNKRFKEVIKLSSKCLEVFPRDQVIRFMRAKSYRALREFDKAIEDLKYNLDIEYNEYSLTELYYIYYFLNMYDEAIELLPIVYDKRCINTYSVSITELIMKKQLGIDIKVKKGEKCDYIKSQILDYKTDEALLHIQEHLKSSSNNSSQSYFNSDLNLEYLYNFIRNNIDNTKKSNIDEILEIHYFAIYNIGYINNIPCNFLRVIVVPNTNKIITMYPTYRVDNGCITEVNIDYDRLFKRKNNKVKRISQIDKFNSRYNNEYK